MGLGVLDHLVDGALVERRLTGDRHRLLLARGPVLGRDVDDAVGVDVEGDLDLGHAAGRRGQVDELELAERLVVLRHLPLALEDVDLHLRLHVVGGGEGLGLAGGDRGVALDQPGGDAALGLDAERQRGDVEEQDVLDLALEHAGLDGRADGDDLVGVDALVGLLAGHLLDQLGHRGHAGGAAHEDHVVDLALAEPGVLDRLLERALAPLEEVGGELLELGPGEGLVEVERTVGTGGDVGQVDLRRLRGRQLDLGLLGRLLEALLGHRVLAQVDAVGRLEGADHPVDDRLVPVVAAEVDVAVGRLDLEHAVADLQHGDVEGATAEVEHEHRLVGRALLLEPVGQGGRGGLVDDAEHLEAGDLARLLGGGALGVVEVGRDGDDGLGDGVVEVGLGVGLELHQRAGRDLLGRVGLAVDVDLPVGAHVALDRPDGAPGVGDGLALGHLADEHLAGLAERHDRRGRARPLGVGDHQGVAGLEDADDRVGGAEVDADGLGHGGSSGSGKVCELGPP